jgi:hypothetical protein
MEHTAPPLTEVGYFSILECPFVRGRSRWLRRIGPYALGLAPGCRSKIAQHGFRMYVSGQPQHPKTSHSQEARLGGGESPCRNPKIHRWTAGIS